MYKLYIAIVLILSLQGCQDSTHSDSESESSYVCIYTPNLQVAEKATYKFNDDGNVSYLTAEVTEESNNSYTVAFNYRDEKVEYFTWLKSCQSHEILDLIKQDYKKVYILNYSNYGNLKHQEIPANNSSNNADLPIDTTRTFSLKTDTLDIFSVEAGTYFDVKSIFVTKEGASLYVVSEEMYIKDIEGHNGINTPFSGILQHRIFYKDDTNISVELVEWNGL